MCKVNGEGGAGWGDDFYFVLIAAQRKSRQPRTEDSAAARSCSRVLAARWAARSACRLRCGLAISAGAVASLSSPSVCPALLVSRPLSLRSPLSSLCSSYSPCARTAPSSLPLSSALVHRHSRVLHWPPGAANGPSPTVHGSGPVDMVMNLCMPAWGPPRCARAVNPPTTTNQSPAQPSCGPNGAHPIQASSKTRKASGENRHPPSLPDLARNAFVPQPPTQPRCPSPPPPTFP